MDDPPEPTRANQQSPKRTKDSCTPHEQEAPLHIGPAIQFAKKHPGSVMPAYDIST